MTDPVAAPCPPQATVGSLLLSARRRLSGAGIAGADLDARLLVAGTLKLDAAGLVLRSAEAVAPDIEREIAARIERRARREPVHRILGARPFYAHDFALSPDTLEPRPDTEIVVDLCHGPIRRRVAETGSCVFADLGTGTGAIAVTLLALHPRSVCIAVDLSFGALLTARSNAEAAGVEARFLPLLADYLASLGRPLDLVVSNPPYVASADISSLSPEVRDFDPHLALDGGADGLHAYRSIASGVRRVLGEDGDVVVEIGQGQASEVSNCFAEEGLVLAESADDLGGVARALRFRRR